MTTATKKKSRSFLTDAISNAVLAERSRYDSHPLPQYFTTTERLKNKGHVTMTLRLMRIDPHQSLDLVIEELKKLNWVLDLEYYTTTGAPARGDDEPDVYAYNKGPDGEIESVIRVGVKDHMIVAYYTGDQAGLQFFTNFIETNLPDEGMIVENLVQFDTRYGGEVVPRIIHKILPYTGRQDDAHMGFYPFIAEKEKGTMDDWIEEYLQARASVLFMIGSPGTGKTTLARTIMRQANDFRLVTINDPQVIMHPEFASFVAVCNKPTIMLVEDCDQILQSREEGNRLMSTLLNATDGLVNSVFKLIVCTNLSELSSADEAILRPGRCFARVSFSPLVGAEINIARAEVDLPSIEVDEHTVMSLSSALNHSADHPGVREYERTGDVKKRVDEFLMQKRVKVETQREEARQREVEATKQARQSIANEKAAVTPVSDAAFVPELSDHIKTLASEYAANIGKNLPVAQAPATVSAEPSSAASLAIDTEDLIYRQLDVPSIDKDGTEATTYIRLTYSPEQSRDPDEEPLRLRFISNLEGAVQSIDKALVKMPRSRTADRYNMANVSSKLMDLIREEERRDALESRNIASQVVNEGPRRSSKFEGTSPAMTKDLAQALVKHF